MVMFNVIEHCKDNEQGLDKELLFDILIMFNTIWQENDMSNKYNEKQCDSDCRALFLTSPDAVSDRAKIHVFV